MNPRIPGMILRVSALIAIVLGLVSWTGNTLGPIGIHEFFGVLVVLSLWWLGLMAPSMGLKAGALVTGLLVVIIGFSQESILQGAGHWFTQVIHLVLGLAAIGLGEAIGGRLSREAKA